MQNNLKIWIVSLTFLISSTGAIAKPPADADRGAGKKTDAGCEVLMPTAINSGLPYTVKVVRVPRYPGGWFYPTVIIDVAYPTTLGNEIGDSREQTIPKMGVTYVTATFTVPEAFDPDTNEPVIESGGTAKITATVREPMNNGKFKETICTATTVVY